MLDTVVHRWLRVPHLLHVGHDLHKHGAKVTIVFIHGLGNSYEMWQPVISHLTNPSVRVIAVDLLGFGKSPKPEWQTYSASVQAASLYATLSLRQIKGPLIIVGHSLGSLVAIRYAARYPKRVSGLVLCSPPFHQPPKQAIKTLTIPQADDVYRSFYAYSRNKQEIARKVAGLVKRARLLDPSFTVNNETMPAIVSSLEMSIENQTALKDAESLHLPMRIIYGKLDPLIIKSHIRKLETSSQNVTLQTVVAGHEVSVSKPFVHAVINDVKDLSAQYIK